MYIIGEELVFLLVSLHRCGHVDRLLTWRLQQRAAGLLAPLDLNQLTRAWLALAAAGMPLQPALLAQLARVVRAKARAMKPQQLVGQTGEGGGGRVGGGRGRGEGARGGIVDEADGSLRWWGEGDDAAMAPRRGVGGEGIVNGVLWQ